MTPHKKLCCFLSPLKNVGYRNLPMQFGPLTNLYKGRHEYHNGILWPQSQTGLSWVRNLLLRAGGNTK
jgi:hypothetical protein